MLSLPNLLPLFCHVDDFCQHFEPAHKAKQLPSDKPKRNRARSLSTSEILTILIAFHQSGFRNFKTFYTGYVCQHLKAEFPDLVSYHRFVEFIPASLVALFAYLHSLFGKCSGISFIDSTPLGVCDNHRINQHKTFKGIAKRGKTSTGWFFGFKLHLVVSDTGALLNMTLTPISRRRESGNVNDKTPAFSSLCDLFGKVFGDKGYISQPLKETLLDEGVELITKVRKNMKPQTLPFHASVKSPLDSLLLRKRAIIESVIDQLKNISQVEHSRHRASTGFLWNVVASLIAYCHQPKKPSLNLNLGPAIVVA